MTDDVDPREVLRRVESRMGKTSDPFGRFKLEETKTELQQTIDELDRLQGYLQVMLQAHKSEQSEVSEELAENFQQQVQRKEQELKQRAAFVEQILDVAEEGGDIKAWIQEQEEKRRQAMQQNAAGIPPGGMGPQ